jgi:hypothetical protein
MARGKGHQYYSALVTTGVVMRHALLIPFAFALFTPALAREPLLICDSLCLMKPMDVIKPDAELQTLYCRRVFRTDAEGAYWQGLFNNGDIAIGKPMTLMSSDDPKPDPGAANCYGRFGPSNAATQDIRLSGFAYHTKVCDIAPSQWTQGWPLQISICGVTNDGKSVIFFPAHPLPP